MQGKFVVKPGVAILIKEVQNNEIYQVRSLNLM
jgi:hypothetical protein